MSSRSRLMSGYLEIRDSLFERGHSQTTCVIDRHYHVTDTSYGAQGRQAYVSSADLLCNNDNKWSFYFSAKSLYSRPLVRDHPIEVLMCKGWLFVVYGILIMNVFCELVKWQSSLLNCVCHPFDNPTTSDLQTWQIFNPRAVKSCTSKHFFIAFMWKVIFKNFIHKLKTGLQ